MMSKAYIVLHCRIVGDGISLYGLVGYGSQVVLQGHITRASSRDDCWDLVLVILQDLEEIEARGIIIQASVSEGFPGLVLGSWVEQ